MPKSEALKIARSADEESMPRILIVASDLVLEQTIAVALAGKYVLLAATGGEDGLQKALTLKPALIMAWPMLQRGLPHI